MQPPPPRTFNSGNHGGNATGTPPPAPLPRRRPPGTRACFYRRQPRGRRAAAGLAGLTAAELEHWEREGYVVAKGVVGREVCDRIIDEMWGLAGRDPDDRTTWYAVCIASLLRACGARRCLL